MSEIDCRRGIGYRIQFLKGPTLFVVVEPIKHRVPQLIDLWWRGHGLKHALPPPSTHVTNIIMLLNHENSTRVRIRRELTHTGTEESGYLRQEPIWRRPAAVQ